MLGGTQSPEPERYVTYALLRVVGPLKGHNMVVDAPTMLPVSRVRGTKCD